MVLPIEILTKDQVRLSHIVSLGKALDNPYRRRILSLCLDKKLSISELQRELNIAYKNVYNHIKILREFGLIRDVKQTWAKSQEVKIETSKEMLKVLNDLDKKLKLERKKEVSRYKKTVDEAERKFVKSQLPKMKKGAIIMNKKWDSKKKKVIDASTGEEYKL